MPITREQFDRGRAVVEGEPKEGNRDRILGHLGANRGRYFRDDCLSADLKILPRQQVNQICRRLQQEKDLERLDGTCNGCGKRNLVNGCPE